jgi:hypothetical protein
MLRPAHLRCRFGNGSHELKALGRFLKNSCAGGCFRPSFQVEPDYHPRNENQWSAREQIVLPIPDITMEEMCNGAFAMSAGVALAHQRAKIRISITLQGTAYKSHGDRYLSISGFPRPVNINEIEQESRSLRPEESGRSVYPSDAPALPLRNVGELNLPF